MPRLGGRGVATKVKSCAAFGSGCRGDTAGGVSDPQSLHRYLYASANPVNHIDPGDTGTDG